MCFLKFDSEESKKKLRPSAAMRVKTARRNRPPRACSDQQSECRSVSWTSNERLARSLVCCRADITDRTRMFFEGIY